VNDGVPARAVGLGQLTVSAVAGVTVGGDSASEVGAMSTSFDAHQHTPAVNPQLD
jgi:hypothetical protein